jgi:hypothetical protein
MTDPHDTFETRTESQDNAEALARETGQAIADPLKLVAPMLARFMATDRAFAKARRNNQVEGEG